MCNFEARRELINKIEKETDSVLISLIYNTTNSRFRTQLAGDMFEPFNNLLKEIPEKKKKKVLLMLHTAGGPLDVATSFVYLMRKHFSEFNVVIPEIAHSAGTILCLGADNIYMSHCY